MKCMKVRRDMSYVIEDGIDHYTALRLSMLAEYVAIATFDTVQDDVVNVYEGGVMRQVNRGVIVGPHGPFDPHLGHTS